MNERPHGRHTNTPEGGNMDAFGLYIALSHQPRLAALQRSLMLNLVRGLDEEVWIEALDLLELWGHKSLWRLLGIKTRGDRDKL